MIKLVAFVRVRPSTALAFAVLLWLWSGGTGASAQDDPPRAQNGRLDLSGWSFLHDGIVPLNGEWEFYWGQFLSPGDFLRVASPASYGIAEVPGSWPRAASGAAALGVKRHGYGTYRLTVRLPKIEEKERDKPLAIYVPLVNTSYRLWVNDRLIAESGLVATSIDLAVPGTGAQISPFFPQGETVEIVMQVSNFHFREGGIPTPIQLGLSDELHLHQRRREWVDAFLTGLGLLTVLIYVTLYAQNRQYRASAYFSLFVLVLTVRMSFLGNAIVFRLFPGIPWELGLKIEYSLGYLGAPLFFMYLRSLYPQETSRFVVRASWAISLVSIAVVLIFPGRISSLFIPPYLFVLLAYVAYGIYAAALAIKRRREDGATVMIGAIIFLISVFASVLGYANLSFGFEAIHFGVGALIVTQGWILARRFTHYVRTQQRLLAENAAMLERTRFQLSELQRYRRLMREREEGLRSQIAEMLHGRTQSRLLAALRNIDLAAQNFRQDPAEAEQRLHDAKGLLKQVREEDIREVGRRLHPSAVRAGLIPALETLLRAVEDAYRVNLVVDPAIESLDSPEDLRISYDLRLGVYRIVEEALNNIARHADAENVTVTVSFVPGDGDGDLLVLQVADDGKGCDPHRIAVGLGLQTIDARAGDLGGSWRLLSAPGQGTTLRVELPFTPSGTSLPSPSGSLKRPGMPADPSDPGSDPDHQDPEEPRRPPLPTTT